MVALRSPAIDAQPLAPSGRIPDVLEEMAARLPAWHAQAACRGEDPSIFFVERGQPTTEARAICAGCPVRGECRRYAITERISHGVWGGLSPPERRQFARRIPRPA